MHEIFFYDSPMLSLEGFTITKFAQKWIGVIPIFIHQQPQKVLIDE